MKERRKVIDRRVEVRWPQVDERRFGEGRRFTDVDPYVDEVAPPEPQDCQPYQWADAPASGFL